MIGRQSDKIKLSKKEKMIHLNNILIFKKMIGNVME